MPFFSAKMLEVWGPLSLGWVAWGFTMLYLRHERKRYQDLVTLLMEHFMKASLAERKSYDLSELSQRLGDHRAGKKRESNIDGNISANDDPDRTRYTGFSDFDR